MRKWLLGILAVVLLAGVSVYLAFQVSPWPSALLIRHAFDKDAARTAAALEKFVPADVASRLNIAYADGADTRLDLYYPASIEGTGTLLPVIVWIHGGGWLSGSKADVGNYLKILASEGYAAIAVDYSIAPGATYPTPVRQVNDALGYIRGNGKFLHADASRIVLAGDSAGAQIAAQLAAIASNPAYARAVGISPSIEQASLKGVLLNCGPYDITMANEDGPFGGFLRTVLWSYSGTSNYADDPAFATASVAPNVTANFPPAFITAGNGDPLAPQSVAFAAALADKGVAVDTLFFPEDTQPPLPHEYQFNLDGDAWKTALSKMKEFLARVTALYGA